MRIALALLVVGLVAIPASAETTYTYSWEDGVGTILGSYGNLVDDTNVTGPQTGSAGAPPAEWTCPGAYDGDRYLHVAEEPHSGTPQAYIAWIKDLQVGDIVEASYYGWDDIADFPSHRIWAHYATADDIMEYMGSAGEGLNNSGYSGFTGWEQLSSSWDYGNSGTAYEGYGSLVIEARVYSTPTTSADRTDYWMDYVSITVPDYATVIFAPEPASLALLALGGLVVARRRK